MNTIIEQIKAQIERLNSKMDERDPLAPNQKTGYLFALEDVLSFIDTLESEKPMNQDEELTIEQERYWEKNKLVVGEDIDWCKFCCIARHFAQWQKGQMMKEAVEGEIVATAIGHLRIVAEANEKSGVKDGDRVRIIIVKEDKK